MRSIGTAVIVDGYATGRFLPPAFARLGVEVVHVQGSAELIGNLLPPELDAYRANLICPTLGDVGSVATALAAHRPLAVLAGSEHGVRLADLLSERLGVATNGSRHSAARRDKYLMIETLRAAGIRCADQFTAAEPDAIAEWADRHGCPVVVKPPSSSGSDQVYICHDRDDAGRAAAAVLSSMDLFEQPNTEALVQSYLDGVEYVVDTVSADGRHYVCGVWKCEKLTTESGRRIHDRALLLDPSTEPVPGMIAYVHSVLDALDIRHGPAHAEVIVTAAGPTLVEIAARLSGVLEPSFQDRCLGANQADLTALAYTRPEEFQRRFAGRTYTKRSNAVIHYPRTRLDGIVESVDQQAVAAISALPTVHQVILKLGPGKRIRPTVDLPTSPLRIYMIDPDPASLHNDHRSISKLKDLVYRSIPSGRPD